MNVALCWRHQSSFARNAGRAFRQRGKNRIATQLDRWWPIPAQETLSYAPPVLDGNRLYLRGERYLYCIGEKE